MSLGLNGMFPQSQRVIDEEVDSHTPSKKVEPITAPAPPSIGG